MLSGLALELPFNQLGEQRRIYDYDYDNDNLFVDSVADSDGFFGGNFYFTDWDFCFICRISTWKTVCYNKSTHNT